jgi:hypothetical protein
MLAEFDAQLLRMFKQRCGLRVAENLLTARRAKAVAKAAERRLIECWALDVECWALNFRKAATTLLLFLRSLSSIG